MSGQRSLPNEIRSPAQARLRCVNLLPPGSAPDQRSWRLGRSVRGQGLAPAMRLSAQVRRWLR